MLGAFASRPAAALAMVIVVGVAASWALLPGRAGAQPVPAPPPCGGWQVEYALSATLELTDTPLGQGDTNIKGVLEVLKAKKYPIPAMIEYEYGKPGMDTIAEVKKCFDYCKAALAS